MLKYKYVIIFSISFILLLCIMFIPFRSSIVIEDGNTGKVLAYFPLQQTDRIFHIKYTHSIHLTDVKETYQVLEDGTIQQNELMYEDTAIGMPSNAEYGETFEIKNGKYYIRNMARDFSNIHMRTAQVVGEHHLEVNNNDFLFSSIVDPGSLVTIRERKLALWQIWKGVNIIGGQV
ncbi:DUF1850 domain-containing protein [Lederbergia lenta]|uniref:RocC n=1 Tax=Lederbergia lenta TaxID=1467 RepID=A0A2X4W998_LEDLE|nr:DUF1850 domain-containing protein [Lederbergia lenta]MCM3110402.1 DUF1850 domain-containing protein [Lederbergia lenta]MEC2324031.1 DUF1850 domain-containing protein [Lederbergia lenta]SQI60776.1 RocC [Lederbergia lenta]